MRLMVSASSSSSPPQCTSTRRVRSPLENSLTALDISFRGLIWLRARKKASIVPSASAKSAGGRIWSTTLFRLTWREAVGMCSSTAPTTVSSP